MAREGPGMKIAGVIAWTVALGFIIYLTWHQVVVLELPWPYWKRLCWLTGILFIVTHVALSIEEERP